MLALPYTDDYSRNFTLCSTHVLIWCGTMDLRAESEAARQHLGVPVVFDRDLTANGTIDLDMPSVWAAACNSASDLMRKATEISRNCYPCATGSEHHPWCASRAEARMLRQLAYSIMAPFRIAIAERTEAEEYQALSMMVTGAIRFADGMLSDYACESCGRRGAQHITTSHRKTLCPFGRNYWAYARELIGTKNGLTVSQTRVTLSMIARPITR